MTSEKRRRVTNAIVIVALALIFSALVITSASPKLSQDDRIRLLQIEAIDLEIFERTLEIRENAKDIFGWTFGGSEDKIANNVTFGGYDGIYEIAYQDLVIDWADNHEMTISVNGTRVYRADLGYAFLFPGLRVKEITSFVKGPWLDVFDEMHTQAMKARAPPENEADELKENWGIG
jgi:hypothetical protein